MGMVIAQIHSSWALDWHASRRAKLNIQPASLACSLSETATKVSTTIRAPVAITIRAPFPKRSRQPDEAAKEALTKLLGF